jgi:fimbrial chaperone protein
VRLTLPAGASSTSLSLENTGDEAVLVQAQLMAWSQNDGKDVLTPSQDLVVSPPIFTVQPGRAQTVRIGLLRPANAEREVAYRLFLQEVPRPPRPGEPAVSVALRLGLPVFLQPKGGGGPQLAWRAQRDGGAVKLTLANGGNAHVQVLDCKLHSQDGSLLAEEQLGGYVLAGQTRSWLIKLREPLTGGRLKVTAQTSSGVVSADIAAD